LNCSWQEAARLFPSKSVDTIFATDVIEHWEKEDGIKFLQEAERIARHQVVILTPIGLYPQYCQDPDRGDIWGMDGGTWQVHRSGWYLEDFGPGWEIIACESFHTVDEYKQPLEKPHGAFWALRTLDGKVRRRCLASLAFRWTKQRLRGALNPDLYQQLGTLWNRIAYRRGREYISKPERRR
jgi:hypothetical protein